MSTTNNINQRALNAVDDASYTFSPKAIAAEKKQKSLNINDFLKLIVAQMTHQDPMGGGASGTDSTSFMTQLSQITMIEQLNELSKNAAAGQAYGMIGKYVQIPVGIGGSTLMLGRVDGVVNRNGNSYLMVNGNAYGMSEVFAVMDGQGATDEELLKSADLIGKYVSVDVLDEAGEVSKVVGRVDKILVKNGQIHLVIGDKEAPLAGVVEISEEPIDPNEVRPPEEEAPAEEAVLEP